MDSWAANSKKAGLLEVKLIRKTKGNQKGSTLTEVIIALAIFGMVGASLLGALNTSSKALVSANEITIAESLSRTVIEHVKRSAYDSTNDPPLYDSDSVDVNAVDYGVLLGLDGEPYYGDYTVQVDIERLDPEADGTGDDDGMQKITVEISYQGGRWVLITEAYKVDR